MLVVGVNLAMFPYVLGVMRCDARVINGLVLIWGYLGDLREGEREDRTSILTNLTHFNN